MRGKCNKLPYYVSVLCDYSWSLLDGINGEFDLVMGVSNRVVGE
jgi:hypothetical protein